MEKQLNDLREALAAKIKEKTENVARIATMKGENYRLQETLDEAQRDTRPDHSTEKQQNDMAQRHKIQSEVTQQLHEIQLLKVQV